MDTKKTHKLSNSKKIDGKRQIETRHSHLESVIAKNRSDQYREQIYTSDIVDQSGQ